MLYYNGMNLLLIMFFGASSLLAISLLRAYRHVSEKELKRRARAGDTLAAALYRAAAYGPSLGAVLWFLVIVSNALFFVRVAQSLPTLVAILLSALLIWFAFLWLPPRDVTRWSNWLAAQAAPVLAWLLNYLHPVIDRVAAFVERHRPITIHTGLYDKEDLLDLLSYQRLQPDNRVSKAELDIAVGALTFGDQLVRDVMVPRRVVKMVSAAETVGPVLMTELHASGHSRFPVYEETRDTVVGTLFLRDLVKAKAGGQLKSVMHADICYVHDEQPLTEALQAILKTHRHLLIVVNSFEEYVGIITLEDVLEQLVGQPIIDEFDRYEDLRAVAARVAQKEHQAHIAQEKDHPLPKKPK